MIERTIKRLTNRIKINHKLSNVRSDFWSLHQTKSRMKTVRFQIEQTKTTETRFFLNNRNNLFRMPIRHEIVNFWKTTILKKKENYRSDFISNNWNRRDRENFYRFNRWQNFSNRYENRKQYQKTYVDKKRFYEKEFDFFESYENINSNEKFDDEKSTEFYSYNLHSKSSNVCKKCDKSKKIFFFNNVFHSHIRSCSEKKSLMKIIQKKILNLSIIKFSISFAVENDLDFRFYQYAIVWLKVDMKFQIKTIVDTECSMSLIDENYLKNILSNLIISKMSISIKVCDINNALYECIIYVMLNIFLNDTSQTVLIREQLHKKFHIMKNFKCKIFLKMNILNAKQMNIDLINKIMIIFICKNLMILIKIIFKSNARIRKIVHSKKKIIISFKSVAKIPTYLKKKKFQTIEIICLNSIKQILSRFLKKLKASILTYVIAIFCSFRSRMICSYQWFYLSVFDWAHWPNMKKKTVIK